MEGRRRRRVKGGRGTRGNIGGGVVKKEKGQGRGGRKERGMGERKRGWSRGMGGGSELKVRVGGVVFGERGGTKQKRKRGHGSSEGKGELEGRGDRGKGGWEG